MGIAGMNTMEDETDQLATVTEEEETNAVKDETLDGKSEKKNERLWKKVPYLGLILTLLRVTINMIRQAGIKELTGISPMVYQMYQTMFSLSMSMSWSVWVRKEPFPTQEPRKVTFLLLLRGVSSCLTSLSCVFALQQMPLGTYSMVNSTRPFFSLILARFFLSEPCGIPECVTMALLLGGVLCVVKPPGIFPQDQIDYASYGEQFYLAVVLLLLGTITAGNTMVILRHLRKQHIARLTASKDIIGALVLFLGLMVSGVQFSNQSAIDRLKIGLFSISF